MNTTTEIQRRNRSLTLGRQALPAAFLLAVLTMGSAHGTQAPGDQSAEFDPGAVCSSVSAPAPSVTGDARVSALVISAHAASLHAAR